MTKTYFPFDAGVGADVTEDQWRKMARLWLSSGVVRHELQELEVYADSSGMQVKIRPGIAWVRGHYYENDAEEIIAISGNSSGAIRIDTVVLRADFTSNTLDTVVKEGDPGGAAPSLTQTSAVWEIRLADVTVVDAAVTIDAGDVSDGRSYSVPGTGMFPEVFDVTGYGAVPDDGTIDDTAAIQAAINAVEAAGGGVVYFPAGTYLVTAGLTVDAEGVWLVGESRENTIVNLNVGDTLVDGLSWVNSTGTAYVNGGGIRDLTIKAETDRADVRDVAFFDTPGDLVLERVTFRGGARYGVNINLAINISMNDCIVKENATAGLYIAATTSVSTTFRARGCYFQETKSGPNINVRSLGATFESCLFESAGATTAAGAYGAQIASGYATFVGCYWENNADHDLHVAAAGGAQVTVVNFRSLTGPYTTAGKYHIYIGANTEVCTILGGDLDTRKAVGIEPGATHVRGFGMNWGTNPPEMTDASDINANGHAYFIGQNPATGNQQTYGRVDGLFRQINLQNANTSFVALPDGLATSLPVRFLDEATTGFMRSASGQIRFVGAGTVMADIDPTAIHSRAHLRADKTVRCGSGASGSRPNASVNGAGSMWFDTTLGKPIWSNGSVWVDATGAAV